MADTIHVLNIEMQQYRVQKVMSLIQEYIHSEGMHTIEIVTMETLLQAEEEKLQEAINASDLVLPGEKEILRGLTTVDDEVLQELADHALWKQLARYFEKKKIRIFLLAESEKKLKELQEIFWYEFKKIRVLGGAILSKETLLDEQVVNQINVAGVDCVLGVLGTPAREYFVQKNRALINANLWIGVERIITEKDRRRTNRFGSAIMKLVFHHKVEQEKK